jgi:hypothetical protein
VLLKNPLVLYKTLKPLFVPIHKLLSLSIAKDVTKLEGKFP